MIRRFFSLWMVKRREFSLLNLPSVGMKDVLVVPAKDEKVQFS